MFRVSGVEGDRNHTQRKNQFVAQGEPLKKILGVMTKHWTPGHVKTRLGRSIGMAPAAAIHRRFLEHLTHSLQSVGDVRQLVVQPPPTGDVSAFGPVMSPSWEVTAQGDGDLGERMRRWFAGSSGDRAMVLIGADCPLIDPATIRAAMSAWPDADLVIGPADDGGYTLIGLRLRAGDRIDRFDSLWQSMPWGTDAVLARTLATADRQGWSVATLPVDFDVDTVADLQRLLDRLASRRDPSAEGLLRDLRELLA